MTVPTIPSLPSRALIARCLSVAAIAACLPACVGAPAEAASGYGQTGSFENAGGRLGEVALDQASGEVYAAAFMRPPGFGPGDIERFDHSGSPLNSFGGIEEARFSGVAVDPNAH